MRVLLIITGLGMGGAEKVVTSLADALVVKGHEVIIVYMTGPKVVVPLDPRVKVIGLSIESKISAISAFFNLGAIVRDFKPNVVHSHMVHANIFSRLVRLIAPVPRLVSTVHNLNEGGFLRMLAYRLTDRLADISTNVSAEAMDAFIKARAVSADRMIAVYNGISTSYFSFNATARAHVRDKLGVNGDCRLILAVGRLHEQKDYPNLLHALMQLRNIGVTYKMCIVGDGPLRGKLEAIVSELGLADCVQFLGVLNNVPDLISAADVFVLPSAWEGFGLVVAEAMACERVVVATDCGGVREVVGEAGYLVRPRDPKALAEALETTLLLTPHQSAAIGRAARQRVIERFSLNEAVEKWLQIYAGNFIVD